MTLVRRALFAAALAAFALTGFGAEAKPSRNVTGVACDTYTNKSGHQICRPRRSTSVPPGATARCRDGAYSFSEHRRGTCSHHGGVRSWL
ncbi:MAG: DUF3761 domain-containing protein [Proteobacteria bacterium]|nr:DUF3761 domain-containing protein [Pseudomonadota bacterium]